MEKVERERFTELYRLEYSARSDEEIDELADLVDALLADAERCERYKLAIENAISNGIALGYEHNSLVVNLRAALEVPDGE